MTFMRVARDQRGYETTLLLYTRRPGDRPRVLYWYRTAPGVRVGRGALDEDAIRAIEEQHPDVEFDWPQLIEEAASVPPEVERRPERPRRKTPRQPDSEPETPRQSAPETAPVAAAEGKPAPATDVEVKLAPVEPPRERNILLDQLVGREIAARLRTRYAEVVARLSEYPAGDARDAFRRRADALDPDRWASAEAILAGVQHADRLFDDLKKELI
jgi:hypothetical protein